MSLRIAFSLTHRCHANCNDILAPPTSSDPRLIALGKTIRKTAAKLERATRIQKVALRVIGSGFTRSIFSDPISDLLDACLHLIRAIAAAELPYRCQIPANSCSKQRNSFAPYPIASGLLRDPMTRDESARRDVAHHEHATEQNLSPRDCVIREFGGNGF
jgi:hypothetical protein